MEKNIRNILGIYKNCEECGPQKYSVREIFSIPISKFLNLIYINLTEKITFIFSGRTKKLFSNQPFRNL